MNHDFLFGFVTACGLSIAVVEATPEPNSLVALTGIALIALGFAWKKAAAKRQAGGQDE